MRRATSIPVLFAILLTGCAGGQRWCEPCASITNTPVGAPRPTPPNDSRTAPTPPARAYALYDGKSGAATSLETFLAASKDADVVAFGELHGHPVGAEMELATLQGMAAGSRPVALAMEFFERDVQGALDDYLASRTTEAEFLKIARQGPAYPTTHRPLIEFAKAHRVAVLAANAPRRLVTEYRKGEKTYTDYLAGLPATDRGFLPAETSVATGPYLDRFTKLMGGDRGSKLIKAQSLWDDAMADVIASYRASHPDARVMLVVGGFHVAARLGTISKFSARRPNDRVRLLVMTQGEPQALAFDPDDRDEGDAILTVARVAAPSAPEIAPTPTPTRSQP